MFQKQDCIADGFVDTRAKIEAKTSDGTLETITRLWLLKQSICKLKCVIYYGRFRLLPKRPETAKNGRKK